MSLMPWPLVLAQAAELGISPSLVWTLSVLEWRALMGTRSGSPPMMNRADFQSLAHRFPDQETSLS